MKKTNHERISPETIFVEKENNFKLLKVNNELGALQNNRNLLFSRKKIYVSPIIYEAIQKSHFHQIKYSEPKNDIFALGLCILEAGIGKSI